MKTRRSLAVKGKSLWTKLSVLSSFIFLFLFAASQPFLLAGDKLTPAKKLAASQSNPSPSSPKIPYSDDELFRPGRPAAHTGDQLREIAFPLGGIGTGTISLGGRGQLRDWEIFNRPGKGINFPFTFLLSTLKVMAAASAGFWNPSFSHLIPVLMAIHGRWYQACPASATPPFAASIL